MFTVERINDNQLYITFGGKLDAEEMTTALDDLLEKSRGMQHGQMLFVIEDYKLPTLGAIGVELARLPQLFGFIGRFDQAAVLADEDWIKSISEFEGKLIPGLEIKAFGTDKKLEAELWLQSVR